MTDPRVLRTAAAVHAAALAVLRREGIGGTTMDAIAAEAGVARSTLYRNWHSRDALLADAIDAVGAPPGPDDGDRPALEQLERVLVDLARALRSSEWGATLPAIVAATHADPAVAERYREFTDARRRTARDLLERAVDDGSITWAGRLDDLLDALVGPLFYRALVRRVPTSPAWVRAHLQRTIGR